ncbi:Os11g0584400 [Oryza sativa Japonica Group]|uniref:Os11g0584400 protein n=1 Tax=Oryza sativa subsp. japonica TaxID=39947 RepID=A0A0N7KT49_ORYSJ|nr:Os11g0584400 [Oryza sativa Japonica Group]
MAAGGRGGSGATAEARPGGCGWKRKGRRSFFSPSRSLPSPRHRSLPLPLTRSHGGGRPQSRRRRRGEPACVGRGGRLRRRPAAPAAPVAKATEVLLPSLNIWPLSQRTPARSRH